MASCQKVAVGLLAGVLFKPLVEVRQTPPKRSAHSNGGWADSLISPGVEPMRGNPEVFTDFRRC